MDKTRHVSFLDYHNIILLLGLSEPNQGYGIAKKNLIPDKEGEHTHTHMELERERVRQHAKDGGK